jgi:hypothetical protein
MTAAGAATGESANTTAAGRRTYQFDAAGAVTGESGVQHFKKRLLYSYMPSGKDTTHN